MAGRDLHLHHAGGSPSGTAGKAPRIATSIGSPGSCSFCLVSRSPAALHCSPAMLQQLQRARHHTQAPVSPPDRSRGGGMKECEKAGFMRGTCVGTLRTWTERELARRHRDQKGLQADGRRGTGPAAMRAGTSRLAPRGRCLLLHQSCCVSSRLPSCSSILGITRQTPSTRAHLQHG